MVLNNNPKIRQWIAALSVCLGAVAAGTVLGWTANLTEKIKKGDYNKMKIGDAEMGWIGSCMTIGALLMCFPTGFCCNLLGRKLFLLIISVPLTIGWICLMAAKHVALVYIGRILTGIGGGVFCIAAPLYTSEISQASIRGALGSCFQLLLVVGILIVYIAGAFASPVVVSFICFLIPIIFTILFLLVPETPIYLLMNHRDEDAKNSLIRLRGKDFPDIDSELAEMKRSIEERQAFQGGIMKTIQQKETKKALIICFALMFFQQLSGINAVIFYSGTIFKEAETNLAPEYATIIIGVVQVIATLISTMTVDRFGRKILLIISDFFMAVGTFLLGLYFTLKNRKIIDESEIPKLGWLPIFALSLFIIVFSLGFGPIPWMIQAELLPNEIKAVAASSAGTFNWFLAFVVTSAYLAVAEAISTEATFFIFTIISLCGTIFILIFLPETKGKSFAEIMELLKQ